MYYQKNIAEQLQTRYSRMKNAVQNTYHTESKYLVDLIEKTPLLRGIVQEMEALDPEILWNEWKQANSGTRDFSFPETESGMAKICYGVIKECAQGKHAAMTYTFLVTAERNIDFALQEVTRIFYAPFIQYLLDKVGTTSNVLYLLEKYKRRTEWFYRESLLGQSQVNTRQSELVLDTDLRKYLFDQGIDYPFSTPSSISGRADIVADVGEEKPLTVEIKIFDPDRGYDRSYIRKGFRQIYDYTNDYNQSTGYLVIFNTSSYNLILQSNNQSRFWPIRIELDYKTIFLIVIDLFTHDLSSSKRKTLQPYHIDENFLTTNQQGQNNGA